MRGDSVYPKWPKMSAGGFGSCTKVTNNDTHVAPPRSYTLEKGTSIRHWLPFTTYQAPLSKSASRVYLHSSKQLPYPIASTLSTASSYHERRMPNAKRLPLTNAQARVVFDIRNHSFPHPQRCLPNTRNHSSSLPPALPSTLPHNISNISRPPTPSPTPPPPHLSPNPPPTTLLLTPSLTLSNPLQASPCLSHPNPHASLTCSSSLTPCK